MKACIIFLVISAVGNHAMPDWYNNKLPLLRPQWQQQEQQLPQVEHLQWEQQQQQQPHSPQWQQIKLQEQQQPEQRQQQPPVWPWPPQFPDFMTTTTTTAKPAVLDPRCPKVDDPKNVILLPARGDCQKFLMCSAGYAFEMECPAGLEFAVLLNRCDYPSVAKCSSWGW